jgi:hypothetical protein
VHGLKLVWPNGSAPLAGPLSLLADAAGLQAGPPADAYHIVDPLAPDAVLRAVTGPAESCSEFRQCRLAGPQRTNDCGQRATPGGERHVGKQIVLSHAHRDLMHVQAAELRCESRCSGVAGTESNGFRQRLPALALTIHAHRRRNRAADCWPDEVCMKPGMLHR